MLNENDFVMNSVRSDYFTINLFVMGFSWIRLHEKEKKEKKKNKTKQNNSNNNDNVHIFATKKKKQKNVCVIAKKWNPVKSGFSIADQCC